MSAGHDPADAIGLVTHYFSHLSVAAVRLTEVALAGGPAEGSSGWWRLLLGFDVIFVTVGLLTFEFVLEP